MECPECKFDNREGAKYCRNCGVLLESDIICSNCGATNLSDSSFCEKCGQNLKRPEKKPSVDENDNENNNFLWKYT